MTEEPFFFEFLDLTPLRRGPYPTTGNTGLLCSGELFIESVKIFLARISIVFLLQAGSPPKHTMTKFKKCCVSIKIQGFGDWHSWDRTVIISLKSSAMCHSHTGPVLHVGHSELANFLFLSSDKSCLSRSGSGMPTEIIYVCFGVQIMEDSPCFPAWTTGS